MSAIARRERARSRSVRTGLVTLVGAAAVTAFALTAQNGMPDYVPGVARNTVEAKFEDVGALRAGDDVRIANVRAGFVSSIKLQDGEPVAVLELDNGRKVYENATIEIGARSALGQKYVELDPGSADSGELTGAIPADQTQGAVELDAVLDTFDRQTRKATGSALREVGGGMMGRAGDLNDGLDGLDEDLKNLATISRSLATADGSDLAALLRTADVVASSLEGQRSQLASLTKDAGVTLEALAVDDGGRLAEVLREAPGTLRDVRGALETLDAPLADTQDAVRALRPGAEALGDAMPNTRGLLRDAVSPLKKVPGVANDADLAVDELTPLLADARPLVRELGTALNRAEAPLTTLAPYSPEALLFFSNAGSAMSQTDQTGGWLRFYPVVNPENVIGNLPVQNPLLQRQAYPAPGEAPRHRTSKVEVLP